MKLGKLGHGFASRGQTASRGKILDNFLARWKMDENNLLPIVADEGGRFNGLFNDAAGDPATSNHSVTGHHGTALSFDGVDDFIDLGDDSRLNLSCAYTEDSVSGDIESHQGVIVDTSNIYTIHTDTIYKRATTTPYASAASVSIATIVGQIPESFTNTPNHFGDGTQYGDFLYIPLEYWLNCSNHTDHYIVKIRKSDLSVVDYWNIDAQAHECAGIATDGVFLYCVSYCVGTTIWKYSIVDGSYAGSIALSKTLAEIQGIAYNAKYNRFYVVDGDEKYIFSFHTNGQLCNRIWKSDPAYTLEGIDTVDDNLYAIVDEGTAQKIHFLSRPETFVEGMAAMAFVKIASATAEQHILSRYEYDDNKRQYDLFVQTGNYRFRISENGEGGTLGMVSAAVETLDEFVHVAGVWDPSIEKLLLYVDGELEGTLDFEKTLTGFDQSTGIGTLLNTPVAGLLAGDLDDVIVCDFAPSQAQIQQYIAQVS